MIFKQFSEKITTVTWSWSHLYLALPRDETRRDKTERRPCLVCRKKTAWHDEAHGLQHFLLTHTQQHFDACKTVANPLRVNWESCKYIKLCYCTWPTLPHPDGWCVPWNPEFGSCHGLLFGNTTNAQAFEDTPCALLKCCCAHKFMSVLSWPPSQTLVTPLKVSLSLLVKVSYCSSAYLITIYYKQHPRQLGLGMPPLAT